MPERSGSSLLRPLVRVLHGLRRRVHPGPRHDHEHARGRSGTIAEFPTLFLYDRDSSPDHYLPLNQPVWRPANPAAYMRADDVVLGIYLEGNAWALPWWVMKNHHVANLTLDGTPLLVTLCEACSSAAAFDPVIQGERHFFRLVGRFNGTHVMGDDETESIWGSFTGQALHGKHKSLVLDRLPLYQCRWDEWCGLHPESLVAYAPAEARLGHGAEHFPGGANLGPKLRRSLLRPIDGRLASNAMVLGVEVDGRFKAYPLELLATLGGVVNDTVGQEAVVVMHTPGTLMAAAFCRALGDQVLDFERTADGAVVDRPHRSQWNHAGEAQSGPLAGKTLPFVRSGVEEWYVWAAYHPDTTIFDQTGDA